MSISLQHDAEITIATELTRKGKNWKSEKILWSDLVKRISTTQRTSETFDQYMAAAPARQAEIKDIGGFVGGYVSGGRRNKNSILYRAVVTLDIDHSSVNLWPEYIKDFTSAAACYSTHKHCDAAPRLRLILPLDRECTPSEYVAISRKIAGSLGIENFDDTTFEPERLMYWPSTPKDAEFFFEYQDGPFISADDILASYINWKNASEWPVSARQGKVLLSDMKKQGDPLEKPHIIGAFCRTYSIAQAIDTFLSEVYEPSDLEDRYTYVDGSTACGLVVYEDKFAYSHHGTDPTSGMLCNAFDLVRVHLYGLQDGESTAKGSSLPSFKLMSSRAMADGTVRQLLAEEKLKEAGMDFMAPYDLGDGPVDPMKFDVSVPPEAPNMDWLKRIERDKETNAKGTINNVCIILENDPKLKGCFGLDNFRHMKTIQKDLPWRKINRPGAGVQPYLLDSDMDNLYKYLEVYYKLTGRNNIDSAFNSHLDANSFHPVKEYLDTVQGSWDGKPRVDSLLINYMGTDDNLYVRTVTRKTLVAAVARIMVPGTKFDYILTLVGPEGIGKSKLFSKLAKDWFSDSFSFTLLGKGNAAYEALQGAWIVESAELTGLKKAEGEAVKQFITKEEDNFRGAFMKNKQWHKRQNIFVASTNDRSFLRDSNGNRRFWPVLTYAKAPTLDVYADLTEYERDQIWAEALVYYDAGETLYLNDEVKKLALDMQSLHTETDERSGVVLHYLQTRIPCESIWNGMNIYEKRSFLSGKHDDSLGDFGELVLRDEICCSAVWEEALGGSAKDATSFNLRFIHDVIRNSGDWKEFTGRKHFEGYGLQKGYFRISDFKQMIAESDAVDLSFL